MEESKRCIPKRTTNLPSWSASEPTSDLSKFIKERDVYLLGEATKKLYIGGGGETEEERVRMSVYHLLIPSLCLTGTTKVGFTHISAWK